MISLATMTQGYAIYEDGVLVYSDEMSKPAAKPGPAVCAEVWNETPIDGAKAWAAVTAMCEGAR